MAELTEPLKNGTPVKILHSGFKRAWVLEYRGPLGPKGARIYSVLAVKKPRLVIEVREDQLEVLDEKEGPQPESAPPTPRPPASAAAPEDPVPGAGEGDRRDSRITYLTEPLKDGTIVKIRNSDFNRARILEYRGPLGPKGARIYRILAKTKPNLIFEVREDQLEVVEEKD